jgi:integrase
LDKACRQLEIPIFGYHAFRHLYAIKLAMAHTPLIIIRDRLGHESTEVTNIYLKSLACLEFL